MESPIEGIPMSSFILTLVFLPILLLIYPFMVLSEIPSHRTKKGDVVDE